MPRASSSTRALGSPRGGTVAFEQPVTASSIMKTARPAGASHTVHVTAVHA